MNGPIICGVDDSESAKGAARVARALGGELGLDVVFVRAVEADVTDAKISAIAERLAYLSANANGADSGAAWIVEGGHPVDVLLGAAKMTQASMIVVGSTGPRSSLLGSVSADVSRRAPCPVVVIAPGADARVDGRPLAESRAIDDFAGGIARFGLGSRERQR